MHWKFLWVSIFIAFTADAQKNSSFFIVHYDTSATTRHPYVFINEKNDTIAKLDSSRYLHFATVDTVRNLAIAAIRGLPGWTAIDRNEKTYFQVYNMYIGEPGADSFREGLIRIVDAAGKIGFGNEKGEVVIPYQFEMATHFVNGYAIIASACKLIPVSHEPGGCEHYMRECKQYGYIDKTGKIIELNAETFEEVAKKINWQSED